LDGAYYILLRSVRQEVKLAFHVLILVTGQGEVVLIKLRVLTVSDGASREACDQGRILAAYSVLRAQLRNARETQQRAAQQ
jgi:hypothetical protein